MCKMTTLDFSKASNASTVRPSGDEASSVLVAEKMLAELLAAEQVDRRGSSSSKRKKMSKKNGLSEENSEQERLCGRNHHQGDENRALRFATKMRVRLIGRESCRYTSEEAAALWYGPADDEAMLREALLTARRGRRAHRVRTTSKEEEVQEEEEADRQVIKEANDQFEEIDAPSDENDDDDDDALEDLRGLEHIATLGDINWHKVRRTRVIRAVLKEQNRQCQEEGRSANGVARIAMASMVATRRARGEALRRGRADKRAASRALSSIKPAEVVALPTVKVPTLVETSRVLTIRKSRESKTDRTRMVKTGSGSNASGDEWIGTTVILCNSTTAPPA